MIEEKQTQRYKEREREREIEEEGVEKKAFIHLISMCNYKSIELQWGE